MSLADIIAAKKADTAPAPAITPENSAALSSALTSKPAAQTFAATDMFRFVRADGSWKEAVDGVFTPETQEEYDMLSHYASIGKVEEITGE